jgi:dCMP deaminase
MKEVWGRLGVRVSKDQYYLHIAEAVAERSTCLSHQYGAIIVKNDEIIATGYNGAPRGEENCCDRGYCYREQRSEPISEQAARHGTRYGSCVAVHAEQNAIISAARRDMQKSTMYLGIINSDKPAIPCNMCDRMIKNAGITRVVTREGD